MQMSDHQNIPHYTSMLHCFTSFYETNSGMSYKFAALRPSLANLHHVFSSSTRLLISIQAIYALGDGAETIPSFFDLSFDRHVLE